MQKGNLLIVDDNQELLLALKILLKTHFKKIDTTRNTEVLSKKLKEYSFIPFFTSKEKIRVLDLSLPK